jgi:phosphoribosyl 1,2-cyclic phosphodiesterase
VPVFGDQFRRYGGGTTCYSIEVGSDHQLLIDCGTGALDMPPFAHGSMRFSILITHMHWDHTLALPFFKPLYDSTNDFHFYGREVEHLTIEQAIDHVMQPPWFPIHFTDTPAAKTYHHVDEEAFDVGDIRVTTTRLNHPSGVTAYRLDRDGSSVVIATDNEHGDPESDRRLLQIAEGADTLFYDAQYLPDEYVDGKVGWGHSTWKDGVEIAKKAGVKQLVITSHDWTRSDDDVDKIVEMARAEFPNTIAAAAGLTIEIQ